MDLDIAGKVALVTGGGRGIGYAICSALIREGATVALNDIDGDRATLAVKKLQEVRDGGASAFEADVADFAQVQAMVEQVRAQLGPIDILVNNAGAWVIKPFVETAPDDWAVDLDNNLRGVLHCTRAVLPDMISRRSGAIVSIASEAGRVGEYSCATYSAAKAGIIGFTKAVAKEVGRYGIRINCVAPSTTRTPQSEQWFGEEQLAKMARSYPLRRIGEPEDHASAVLFLASSRAGWVTGQTYGVNGGYAMP